MPGPKTGHQMKLYRNTATVASPTWQEIGDVGDVSIPDFARGLAELKRRGNNYTKNLASIFQTIACEYRLIYGLDSTVFDALRSAFLAGDIEQYAIMDGDIATSGSEGWTIPFIMENFPWDQPLEEVSSHDIRMAIGYMDESGEVDPAWLTVP